MPGLLLIAHAPLASALKAVAEHTFPNCAPQLAVLDVTPEMSAEEVEAAARALMRGQLDRDLSDESVARLDYRLSPECRNGGTLDLRPDDAAFP